ncbi:hypothetical protein OGX69_12745 [Citrobacter sp. Cb130]|uniref:hypothetical protein n=1 Tax=Citrobacter sp. Cb130 TaxID=2985033 RepID=UPI00257648A0|nr:hypothetical protein [Citrobacter sp. Cb130]MDM3328699.1 hypothetical protein [Citrobacter sp. Cb130]
MGSNIIELAKLGHERAAELKASCGAVDVRNMAQLISDLATQLEVQHVRSTNMAVQLANAESKCRELAVECKTLSRFISGSCYVFDGDHDDDMPDEFIDASHYMPIVTPATEAVLAEVRASELDSLAGVAETMLVKFSNQLCSSDIHEVVGWKMVLQQASNRAAQLRKGAAL